MRASRMIAQQIRSQETVLFFIYDRTWCCFIKERSYRSIFPKLLENNKYISELHFTWDSGCCSVLNQNLGVFPKWLETRGILELLFEKNGIFFSNVCWLHWCNFLATFSSVYIYTTACFRHGLGTKMMTQATSWFVDSLHCLTVEWLHHAVIALSSLAVSIQ